MNIKSVILSAALAGSVLAGGAAQAATEQLDMTFASGATFSGLVTFSSDYSLVLAVTGTLTGYQYINFHGYIGSGSEAIDWVYANWGAVSGAGTNSFSLIDSPGTLSQGYENWIDIAYDYSAGSTLTFVTPTLGLGAFANNVDYNDRMVLGSIGGVPYIAAVPEASTWVMMLAGFVGLGIVRYRSTKSASIAA